MREHKTFGPYVDGLKQLAVQDYEAINRLMEEGNRSRTVAATNMNSESSRYLYSVDNSAHPPFYSSNPDGGTPSPPNTGGGTKHPNQILLSR